MFKQAKQAAGMIQKVQQLQKQMETVQAELLNAEYTGSAANNLVTVRIKGTGEVLQLTISPTLIVPAEADMLADAVAAAINNANANKDATSKAKLSQITDGVLPFGLKIPGLG